MATDQMYELAFAYKKTKLWKSMFDSEVFAVNLPDGEIGYCSVMGLLGEHISLAVYPGAEGYNTFRLLAFSEDDDDSQPDSFQMLSQYCLQCSFENKDFLRPGEAEEVRAYARTHKIALRGSHSYPQFSKYMPYRFPWEFQDETDNGYIIAALQGAIDLFTLLQTQSKEEIGLLDVDEDSETIPLIARNGTRITVTPVPLPPPAEPSYPIPPELSEEEAQPFREMKKKGILECELFQLQQPVMDDEGLAPCFPVMLLCADSREGYLLPVSPADHYAERPETLLNSFMDAVRKSEFCPRAMKVRNNMTLALLEDFCMKTGVLLTVDSNLPELDQMKEYFIHFISQQPGGDPDFDDDDDDDDDDDNDFDIYEDDNGYEVQEVDMEEMFEQLMSLSDGELRSMPKEFVNQLLAMSGFGILPEKLRERLRKIFHR